MRARNLLPLLAATLLVSSCILVAGCVVALGTGAGHRDGHRHGSHGESSGHRAPDAHASIAGKSGSSLSGNASFTSVSGGVLVEIEVESAPPGWHAVHVHETGDCSSDDGKSAGGHFNPGGQAHGSPHAPAHHAGDLGNMWVDEQGNGHHVILMPELTVSEGDFSVVGRGIIVHAGADDLVSQPTGAAGGRIGCGVIR